MKTTVAEKQKQSCVTCLWNQSARVQPERESNQDLSREKHVAGMERIQQAAIKLAHNNVKINHKMMLEWQALIAKQQQQNKSTDQSTNLPQQNYHHRNMSVEGNYTYESSIILQYITEKEEYEASLNENSNKHNTSSDSDTSAAKSRSSTTLLAPTDANIHHLFDILTTFNSLFYASAHLAEAAMDLGNTLYTILLLEKKVDHMQF